MRYLLMIILISLLFACSKEEDKPVCEISDFIGQWEAIKEDCDLDTKLNIIEGDNPGEIKVNHNVYKVNDCLATSSFGLPLIFSINFSILYSDNKLRLVRTSIVYPALTKEECIAEYEL